VLALGQAHVEPGVDLLQRRQQRLHLGLLLLVNLGVGRLGVVILRHFDHGDVDVVVGGDDGGGRNPEVIHETRRDDDSDAEPFQREAHQ